MLYPTIYPPLTIHYVYDIIYLGSAIAYMVSCDYYFVQFGQYWYPSSSDPRYRIYSNIYAKYGPNHYDMEGYSVENLIRIEENKMFNRVLPGLELARNHGLVFS